MGANKRLLNIPRQISEVKEQPKNESKGIGKDS